MNPIEVLGFVVSSGGARLGPKAPRTEGVEVRRRQAGHQENDALGLPKAIEICLMLGNAPP
jgi:hypothetical protein